MAKQKKIAFMHVFVVVIILVAIAAGVFAQPQLLARDQLILLINFRDFFEFTLPILAFGALIKYLSSCKNGCSCSPECKCCSTKK